jgi:hypothetical protein
VDAAAGADREKLGHLGRVAVGADGAVGYYDGEG